MNPRQTNKVRSSEDDVRVFRNPYGERDIVVFEGGKLDNNVTYFGSLGRSTTGRKCRQPLCAYCRGEQYVLYRSDLDMFEPCPPPPPPIQRRNTYTGDHEVINFHPVYPFPPDFYPEKYFTVSLPRHSCGHPREPRKAYVEIHAEDADRLSSKDRPGTSKNFSHEHRERKVERDVVQDAVVVERPEMLLRKSPSSHRGSRRSSRSQVRENTVEVISRSGSDRRTNSADRQTQANDDSVQVEPAPSSPIRRNSTGQVPRNSGYESDQENQTFDIRKHLAECNCPCDHLGYSLYPNQNEDSTLFPPDITHANKPDAGFYSNHSSTPSSTSATSGIALSPKHWFAMVLVLLLAAAVGVSVPIALRVTSEMSEEERMEIAKGILQDVPLVDGHNDLPWNIRQFVHNRLRDFQFGEDLRGVSPWSQSAWSHTDLPRLRAGLVGAQFWAAYVPCEAQFKDAVQMTLEQIDVIRRLTDKYRPTLTLCISASDIVNAHASQKMCSLIGVEGGHSLASSLSVLRTLYTVGVRYLTLTSTCNTPWADCSYVDNPDRNPEHNGLTSFGKSIVKEMNRLGMIVDLSHVSVKTMKDALLVSKAPVIFSHSSARALCNDTRNVPDQILRLLAMNGGVVMVNFYSQFLTCKDVSTLRDAVNHIEHVRKIAGVDNVGLGAGYDGINFTPQGLEDVSSYPALFAHLIASGRWSVEDLKKLAGLNFLRVFKEVEKVRDTMDEEGVLPYEDSPPPRPPDNCTTPYHI